jgi:glycerophosphoryl diester phosphodiesterase
MVYASSRPAFISATIILLCMRAASPNNSFAAGAPANAEELLKLPRPLVIGHRGYSHFAPENTLPSFKMAKSAGADLVELDYHHTKDGELVVIHDSELDRTTDAVAKWGGKKIRVADKTMAELKTLDAGKRFGAGYAGTQLPTLEESLDLIQDGNVTLIERKAGDAAACVKLLRERNLVNKVVVQSFDWDYLRDFHQQEPKQVLGALGPPWGRNGKQLTNAEKTLNNAWVDEVEKSGARVVVWSREITSEAVAYAHQRGIKVWVYTIDDPALAGRMLDAGVDGIISNNISLIWRTIATRPNPAGGIE